MTQDAPEDPAPGANRFVAPIEEESRRVVPRAAPPEGSRSRRGWSLGSLLPLILLLFVFAAAVASFVGLVRRAEVPTANTLGSTSIGPRSRGSGAGSRGKYASCYLSGPHIDDRQAE